MQRAKQLTVCVPNVPGMLAKICQALADARVNILAVSVVESTEAGLVRLVVDDARAGAKALEDRKFAVVQTPVRLVELPNKVGALAELAERLSSRKVNVNFAYGSASPGRGSSVLVIEAKSEK